MENKNILITGGAGYVGYTITEELAKRYPNSKIIIYDNLSKGRLENIGVLFDEYKNIVMTPWEMADIRDLDNFRKVINEYKPDVVIHLAAIVDAFTTNREGKDRECEIVNNIASVNIAKICKESGVKSFIFQSTVSVYSRGEDLSEDSQKEPISNYGLSKYKAENSILDLDDNDFNVCVIRSATIVGYNPSFRYETIINMLCIRSLYGINTNIFESALDNQKSYLSLQDEAGGIIFILENIKKLKKEIYNASSFNASINEVIDCIKNEGVDPLISITKEKTINQQVYTIDSSKIKNIGFSPKSSLNSVVKDIIAGIKKRKELNGGLIK